MLKHGAAGHFHVKQLVKDGEHFIYHKSFLLRETDIILQHVQAHWPVRIGRVKINQIVKALLWYIGQDILDIRTMRVYHANAVTIQNILTDHFL